MKYSVLLLIICLSIMNSCSKISCDDGIFRVRWTNFDSSALNMIRVDAYEVGSNQTVLKKTIYSGYSVQRDTDDSVAIMDLILSQNTDYIITRLDSEKTYTITDLGFSKSSYKRGLFSIGEAKHCSNAFSYSINHLRFEQPEILNLDVTPISATILIDKNAKY